MGWQWDTFTNNFSVWSGAVKLFYQQFGGKEAFVEKIQELKHAYLKQSSEPSKRGKKRTKKSACDASDTGTVSDDTTGKDDSRSGVCPQKGQWNFFFVRGWQTPRSSGRSSY